MGHMEREGDWRSNREGEIAAADRTNEIAAAEAMAEARRKATLPQSRLGVAYQFSWLMDDGTVQQLVLSRTEAKRLAEMLAWWDTTP